ncbi:MAG TPA: aminoglycoside phosphotransferase family protein [Terriglobia bacterium]|nr:aminoglycoside phosphotransferase family protein [Terriglobia bacterium]
MSSEDFLLSAENLRGYLASLGLIAGGRRVDVRELGGGVSNVVLLAECGGEAGAPGCRWVVKQSLGKLRVRDDWRSDRERIFREAEAIEALKPVLGESLPEVIHVDRENYAYIMTAAPLGSVVWKESLLAGRRSNPQVAHQVGVLLARMINASRANKAFQKRFWDGTVFDQLRIDPYYRTVVARHPDVREQFDELIGISWNIDTALVHGDYSPKNMLVRGRDVFLIDFEVIHWGDPAFDSGFLLNHLFLKAFHQPRFAGLYIDAVQQFWQALTTGLGSRPPEASDFERMTLRHLGGLMLARIDGKSPVEYIRDEATKESVRYAAKRILLEAPTKLDEVVDLVLGEIQSAGTPLTP